jgi:hypothetical protein
MTQRWPEKIVENVFRHYIEEGQSAAATAQLVGHGMTRNVVIGIAHRRKWARSPEVRALNCRSGSPKLKTPRSKPRAYKDREEPTVVVSSIAERRCAWPIGDPRSPKFRFCEDGAESGRPYCAAHCGRAYRHSAVAGAR